MSKAAMDDFSSLGEISLVEANVNYLCWLHTLRKTKIPLALLLQMDLMFCNISFKYGIIE